MLRDASQRSGGSCSSRPRARKSGLPDLRLLKRPISGKPEIGCDAPQHEGASVKHQPAGVRNDRRGNFIVSGLLLFTMTFATPTCRLMERARFLQGDARADVSLKPPSHLNCS